MTEFKLSKKLSENYVVVCDTNVFLRVYDYSPEFTDFALRCLSKIKPHIWIGYTTQLEYNRNHMGKYSEAKSKIKNMNSNLIKITSDFHEKIIKEFNRIESYHFPDLQELRRDGEKILDGLRTLFQDYNEDHLLLNEINDLYLSEDPVEKFISSLNNQVFPEMNMATIYKICDDGKKRYRDKIPPGFMDNGKDGIRKYSDLFLWKEILAYALTNNKNILFVTDDVKIDWWETEKQENGTSIKEFHKKLLAEFEKNTNQKLEALTSHDLYKIIADEYGIDISDTIDIALQQTNESFTDSVEEDVFDSVCDDLIYSQEEYINGMNTIGSEGLSEFEIESHELISAEQIARDDEEITYVFIYEVCLTATSCEYWGKDDDTKEIITSPGTDHEFKGYISVLVTRYVDQFLDFNTDKCFDEAKIFKGELIETKAESRNDGEYEEEYTASKNRCAGCGAELTIENDSLNSFCYNCTIKYDK